MLAVACTSCNREKTEYGGGEASPAQIVGIVSFESMHVTIDTESEAASVVMRPVTSATAGVTPEAIRLLPTLDAGTRSDEEALNGYLFRLVNRRGEVVSQFPYGAYPAMEVPTGAYTLTAQPATMPVLVWENPVCTATQEVYVRKDATTRVEEVCCTPASIGVALTFDDLFAATSAVTVTGADVEARFTPSEERTAYFLLPEEQRTLTLNVSGSLADGSPVEFSQTFDNLRPGTVYRFTVKGTAVMPPVIEWEGHDISQRYEATAELQAKIKITAAAGIREFKVEIISDVLTSQVLEGIGLTTSFDLIHPGQYAEILKGLGFPTGDAVLNQTSVSFDISPFMPLIPLLGSGDSDFKLTVTDNDDATTVASIMVHSSKEGENPEPEPEPEPDGPEQEFPGGGANPLDPPSSVTEEPFPGGAAGELS